MSDKQAYSVYIILRTGQDMHINAPSLTSAATIYDNIEIAMKNHDVTWITDTESPQQIMIRGDAVDFCQIKKTPKD